MCETFKINFRGKSQTLSDLHWVGKWTEQAGRPSFCSRQSVFLHLAPQFMLFHKEPQSVLRHWWASTRHSSRVSQNTNTGVMPLVTKVRLGVLGHLKNTWKKTVSRGNVFGNLILKQFLFKRLLCKNTSYGSRHYF